jgi:preprotein translocase SecE subunit
LACQPKSVANGQEPAAKAARLLTLVDMTGATMAEENALVAKPKAWLGTTRDFWRDTTTELKKVTWPGRQEVVGTTVVVIIATIVFAAYLWGCDVIFYKMIDFLFSKFGAGV